MFKPMNKYEKARRIALGLQAGESDAAVEGSVWDVGSMSAPELRTEMPFQFFEKKLAPPPEVLAQKTALSLFPEYPGDRKHAYAVLRSLSDAIKAKDSRVTAQLLKKNPAAEWLSFIFLDQEQLQLMLWEPLLEANDDCRATLHKFLDIELSRLVAYTDLLRNILERLGERR